MTFKDDLVRHFRWLRQYGLNDSHSGNGSVRHGDTVWITPADCCADTLSSGDLVECSLDGYVGNDASANAMLHLAVYQSNPNAQALLQSHGPYTVAMTMDSQEFKPARNVEQFAFDRVPVLTIAYDRYEDEAPGMVAEVLSNSPIAIVRGHGVYACAATLTLAYRWICALELSAKTAFIAQQAGKI